MQVLALTHMASLLVLTVFNRVLILNHKQFLECLRFRSPDEGLITVSNHCRCDSKSAASLSSSPTLGLHAGPASRCQHMTAVS